ncbi:N-acetylmuramoyl-L-alanine amidase [Cytobacillus firmus]|uniref:N-acetylmuramoyl-L-alanine amidase n=1 Tax=Cytobacillus firmus TaxID=1399 RepID=UPI00207AF73F|nr:N-acetylmuramoyl-L-alanine amidase [Cytobacillus firmus]USK41521.1 N-acetylmuramoyl-L-alanine amidase [Cytobacillus firmus]
MFFSAFPAGVLGEETASGFNGTVQSESGDDIPLMLESDEKSELLSFIPDGSNVELMQLENEFWYVTYINPDNGEDLLGYVQESYVSIEDSDGGTQIKDTEDAVIAEEEHAEQGKENPLIDSGGKENSDEFIEVLEKNDNTVTESSQAVQQSVNAVILQNSTSVTVYGVALKSPTNVYSSNDAESEILKRYPQGTTLKYNLSDSEWYQCTVYVNGSARTGFIHESDVEEPADPQIDLRGVVKNSKLNVYSKASASSNILKSYTEGSILKFQTYTTDWYQATVFVGGKAVTGYIQKDNIILPATSQTAKKGIVKTSRLNVYAKASNSSNVLKSYAEGSSLQFKTFTDDWYEATVYVGGKAATGYIHRSAVLLDGTPQSELTGIVKPVSLNVYANPSAGSQVLKRYTEGSVLRMKTYTDNWYEATVYVNGKPLTGYIKKSEVLNPDDAQKELTGIVKVISLNVYSSLSRSSGVLKSYEQGRILKYKTYTANWYQATVIVNGKAVTGYIHKQDIENSVSSPVSLTGTAQDPSGVRVYTRASATSDVLKSYPKGSKLKYKTFTSGWHQVTVYINNKPVTGYIKKNSLEKGLKGKVIVVDAGHGGVDNGAKGVEKLLNLKTAIQLESLLKAAGAKVVMSRTTDVFLTLSERVEVSHQYNADAFVSIHYNSNPSPSPHGIETYYWATNVNELLMAKYVQQEVIMQTGLYDRGVKTGDFHVIRENGNAAILVELGFLSNPAELEIVSASAYQKKAATGIYKGLEKYFNL